MTSNGVAPSNRSWTHGSGRSFLRLDERSADFRRPVNPQKAIYLDYAATAPPDAGVVEEMLPYLSQIYGNPSSVHESGRRARHAVEESRERIADVLSVEPGEILFTASGTEADNTALFTVLEPDAPSFLVTSQVEHEAVLSAANHLASRGVETLFLPPDSGGAQTTEAFDAAFTGKAPFVSLMHVNNETGALSPIAEIAERVHAAGGLVHSDAVQSAACYRISALTSVVDMLSLSAHKIGGPKGAGLLFVRSGAPLGRVLHGGSQERRRRGGTENVAGIVGLAAALERAQSDPEQAEREMRGRRDHLETSLTGRLGPLVQITSPGGAGRSCPHILHAIFLDEAGNGLDGEMLILGLDMEGVHVSSGAACSSGAMEPSHVLRAMGVSRDLARGAVRFSLGAGTTDDEIAEAIERIERVVKRVGRRN